MSHCPGVFMCPMHMEFRKARNKVGLAGGGGIPRLCLGLSHAHTVSEFVLFMEFFFIKANLSPVKENQKLDV